MPTEIFHAYNIPTESTEQRPPWIDTPDGRIDKDRYSPNRSPSRMSKFGAAMGRLADRLPGMVSRVPGGEAILDIAGAGARAALAHAGEQVGISREVNQWTMKKRQFGRAVLDLVRTKGSAGIGILAEAAQTGLAASRDAATRRFTAPTEKFVDFAHPDYRPPDFVNDGFDSRGPLDSKLMQELDDLALDVRKNRASQVVNTRVLSRETDPTKPGYVAEDTIWDPITRTAKIVNRETSDGF